MGKVGFFLPDKSGTTLFPGDDGNVKSILMILNTRRIL